MMFARNLIHPTCAYLGKIEDVASTQSIAGVDQATEDPMIQLTPVSQDAEKQAGFDWPFSILLGSGVCVFSAILAACCCRFPPCRG